MLVTLSMYPPKLDAIVYFSNISKEPRELFLLSRYFSSLKKFKVQDIEKTLANEKVENISEEMRATLLKSCGKPLSNRPLNFRIQLCNKVFQKFVLQNCVTVNDYNVFIKVCTENEVNIDSNEFLKSLTLIPNEETFTLLLENVCDRGDTKQAEKILSTMKEREYKISGGTFNSLVLAYAIKEGVKGVNNVLQRMNLLNVPKNSDINWNIVIGLATRCDKNEFIKVLDDSLLVFNEDYFIKLLMNLCLNDNYDLVEKIKIKLCINILPKHFINVLEQTCINLIHRRKGKASIYIYSALIEYNGENNFGVFLLKEIVNAEIDSDEIINICKYLKDTGKNLYALEYITEIILRNNENDRAWLFLQHFDKLRPHYFWPLLINAAKEHGEIGVITTLGKMLDMKVVIDNETLEVFVLPFCDITSPQTFLSRIHHLNLSMRQLLTPILTVLLNAGRVKDATKLCDNYKVVIDGRSLVRPLALAWKNSKDMNSTLNILKRMHEAEKTFNTNVVEYLLENMLKISSNGDDYNEFLKFLQILQAEKFTITTTARENIQNILEGKQFCNIKSDIECFLDKLLNISIESPQLHITHPKNMKIDEMEFHLVELTNKKMETRGILRRLIQGHAQIGNSARVLELRNLFKQSGFIESPGIKSSLLQTYIKTKQSDPAIKIYREIRKLHSNFNIDEFKLLDLATLLVEEDKFEIAMELLKEGCRNRKVYGGLQIERNCFSLLNSTKTPDEAVTLFRLLRDRGFCAPKNSLLGPIVRSYIKSNQLDNAVTCYENCCKNYKCTPLQVELLQIIVEAQNEELLKRVLEATATVYGQKKTQMSLVVVLAEKGMKNALLKLLQEIESMQDSELQNRCNKWINDRKCEPLIVLADVCYKLKSIKLNLNIIHLAIMKIFDHKNDTEGALNFMDQLKDVDVITSREVTNIFNKLMKRHQSSTGNEINRSSSNPKQI